MSTCSARLCNYHFLLTGYRGQPRPARSLWSIDDNPDKIFRNWGEPGTGTEALARYPTDFLRDVIPIPCHSHNDYWRNIPLYSAVHAGCIGVEADVWYFDDQDKSELYVGHDAASLTPARTFQSLCVTPLVELLNRSNPQTRFDNGTGRGIFDRDPYQTLHLLVDLKTDGATTWQHVVAQLEPLRARGWLTHVEDGVVHKRQVTVMGTGNTPFDAIVQNSTYRDVYFDAPLGELREDPDVPHPMQTMPIRTIDYNETNSVYASMGFGRAVGSVWTGLSDDQLRTIRRQILSAHSRGLKARYWDTPAWPISFRNSIWRTLMEEGADILNVDDLRSAANLQMARKSSSHGFSE
ncbi:Uu.00g084250.m01.CDS01 [Anthostomella pinea]|uniref:Altered inheritance of mitochondria protein 6 n=1 Tax=Anthostomella pinea TaxID=933095 RepID=A0AAI8VLQ3_9PEZI|nr:Uu.00g084250.m01.CDS01 [Anthostomella pinea]